MERYLRLTAATEGHRYGSYDGNNTDESMCVGINSLVTCGGDILLLWFLENG